MRWVVWCFLLILMSWVGGFYWFIAHIPRHSTAGNEPVDGIVVLTGGKGRIEHGFSLYASGQAPKILISGVGSEEDATNFITQHARSEDHTKLQELAADIMLDRIADSTYSNAVETAKWVEKNKIQRLRVVTSEYHMPRSLRVLRQAMPDQELIADPVPSEDLNLPHWWSDDYTLLTLLREYHKYLFVLVTGLLL